jgi:hypothetical protein
VFENRVDPREMTQEEATENGTVRSFIRMIKRRRRLAGHVARMGPEYIK